MTNDVHSLQVSLGCFFILITRKSSSTRPEAGHLQDLKIVSLFPPISAGSTGPVDWLTGTWPVFDWERRLSPRRNFWKTLVPRVQRRGTDTKRDLRPGRLTYRTQQDHVGLGDAWVFQSGRHQVPLSEPGCIYRGGLKRFRWHLFYVKARGGPKDLKVQQDVNMFLL